MEKLNAIYLSQCLSLHLMKLMIERGGWEGKGCWMIFYSPVVVV